MNERYLVTLPTKRFHILNKLPSDLQYYIVRMYKIFKLKILK